MADEIFEGDEEAASEDGGERRGGLFSGLAIQILKWMAIVLGAIIFVVTVVVVTLNVLQSDEPTGAQLPASEDYRATLPDYEYVSGVGELRGNTADGISTFIVDIHLGIDEGDVRIREEISRRTPRIRDAVRNLIASQTTEQLRPQNEDTLKQEIRERINAIMSAGRVREVVFDEFQVVPF